MNLVIPQEQHVEQHNDDDQETIMEDLELRRVASNFDDLVSKLKHRFDDLPVHRLCYYQSYYSLSEAMENLRQPMDADPSELVADGLQSGWHSRKGPVWIDSIGLSVLESYTQFCPGYSIIASDDYCPTSPMAWSESMDVRHLGCNE